MVDKVEAKKNIARYEIEIIKWKSLSRDEMIFIDNKINPLHHTW